jgi:hypothetical protein
MVHVDGWKSGHLRLASHGEPRKEQQRPMFYDHRPRNPTSQRLDLVNYLFPLAL